MKKQDLCWVGNKVKISRNAECLCGSGEKYKNCCLNKKNISVKIHTALDIIKEGLLNYDKLSKTNRKYNVKNVELINGETVAVSYITGKVSSMDIKIEMGEIISFVGSFFLAETEGLLFDIPKLFGVKAYNTNNIQILYVVSPLSAVKHIAKGESLEWLKLSHFEDTTQDFILQQAKGQISAIEKSLRRLIYSVLNKKYQDNWVQKIEKYSEMLKLPNSFDFQ
ncbi:MAG TPA: SEC-C metal-binding domain-containing protein [bacterium]|nr:SEC-C metal-binding domain-containing protein [bacterium]